MKSMKIPHSGDMHSGSTAGKPLDGHKTELVAATELWSTFARMSDKKVDNTQQSAEGAIIFKKGYFGFTSNNALPEYDTQLWFAAYLTAWHGTILPLTVRRPYHTAVVLE